MSTQSFRSPAPSLRTGSGDSTVVHGDTGLLRTALWLDALGTGAVGLAALAGCAVLDSPLGLPTAFLAAIGAFLVLYAVGVWRVAAHTPPHRTAVRAVIGLNLFWIADSVVMAAAGWHDPTTLGTVLIVAQAIAVLAFVDLQFLGLRKAAKTAAASERA